MEQILSATFLIVAGYTGTNTVSELIFLEGYTGTGTFSDIYNRSRMTYTFKQLTSSSSL